MKVIVYTQVYENYGDADRKIFFPIKDLTLNEVQGG